jgi:hypothetical protein
VNSPNFLRHAITDEADFTRGGVFNNHNTHVSSDENSHQVMECRLQTQFYINVWAGIIGDRLIGPHILPTRLNGAAYLDFLQNVSNELWEDVPLATRRHMWYLHDSAPSHCAIVLVT